jgi:hypothetical protein
MKLQRVDLKKFLEIEKKQAIIRPQIDQETQQRIDMLVLYLRGKGRGDSTQEARVTLKDKLKKAPKQAL